MKLTRRFLALLLALSMSLSMVTPAYASEAETIDETEPVVVVEETEAAAVETTEAETEAAPVVTTEAETEAPETEAPVVVETETPVVEETEAVVETEAPVVEETEPVVIETEPVVIETEPAVVETEPAVVETEPVVEETEEVVMEEAAEAVNDVLSTELEDNAWMESVADGSVVATYTATSDGTAKMYLDSGFEDVDIIVTDQNGKEYSLLEDGVDNYGLELQIAVKIGDVLSIKLIDAVEAPARTVGWSFVFTYPLGSEQNPIYPEWEWDEEYTVATAKIKVEKKSSAWVTVNGGDMLLTVNGETVEVVPTMNAYGFEAFNVLLENTSSKAKTFTLVQTYAEGAPENPMVLEELSYAELSLKDGDENGFYYSYTVPEDCSYTFYIGSITEGVAADITVYNENSYEFKQLTEDGVDNYGLEMTMDVKAGDLLKINVFVQGSYDENWNYIVPAADLSWNAIATYPAGSLKNPIAPEWMWNEAGTEATATVTVPAGATQWFAGGMGEIVITVNGAEVELETITNPFGMSSSVFSLTNATEADATYELDLSYAVGTRENPEILGDISKFVVNLAKNDSDGRFYTYYNKAAKGTLTFKGSAKKVGFDIILSKAGDYTTYALSESETGTVSIDVAPWDQVYIQVVAEPKANWEYPAAKVTLTSTFEYPLGSEMNPAQLVLGQNAATVEAGNFEGYRFNWTAPLDGELLIAMGENETGWMYSVNNLTASIYGDMMWSDVEHSEYYAVAVNAGDEIQINVNTYDPADMWSNPAGTVNFEASFTAGYEITSGKSLTLKFINPATGKSVSASKVNWAIEGVYVFDPNGEEVEYTDTSAYATIKNGKLKTFKCGDRVNVIVTASLKADPSVSLRYHVVVLPASNIMSIWQTWYETDEYGNIIAEHREPVMGNWTNNINGATEEDAMYRAWDLDAFSYPSNSSQEVTWKSSNKKILTIDEEGVIRPVWNAKKGAFATGTVTITATAADGSGKKASFKVTVDKFPNWMKVERADGVAFEQGEYQGTEFEYNPDTGMWEEVEQYEKIMYITPGETIKLKAVVDPTASSKYQKATWEWWGDMMFSMKKSGNTYSVTAKKNANDGHQCTVNVYSNAGGEQVRVIVKKPVEKKLEITYIDWSSPLTWDPMFDIRDTELVLQARLITSDGTNESVEAQWTSSNKNLTVEFQGRDDYWDCYFVKFLKTSTKVKSTVITATYTLEDGTVLSDTLNVSYSDMNTWVNSLEITAPEKFMGTIMDYVEVWNEEYGYWEWVEAEVPAIYISAGQSVKLTAKVNASAKNKKVGWNRYTEEYDEFVYENVKISSSGKLTVGKNIPEKTMFYVECWPMGNNMVGSVRIPVIVMPRATNVHARIILNGNMRYTSNTTRDWSIAEDGEKLEISALVYPFDASQDVTWTSSNKKVAQIVTEKDAEGIEHTYIVFTAPKKATKVKFTATANDGSKEKATFTLNIGQ